MSAFLLCIELLFKIIAIFLDPARKRKNELEERKYDHDKFAIALHKGDSLLISSDLSKLMRDTRISINSKKRSNSVSN